MKFKNLIFYSLIFLVVSDALLYIGNIGTTSEYIVPISLACKLAVVYNLIYFAKKSNWQDELTGTVTLLFKLIIIWNIITIIRGGLSAHGYWDWKFLLFSSAFFFLVPLAFFVGKSPSLAQAALKFSLTYLFVFGFLAIPVAFVTNHQLYARLMIPASFFIVMIPYLKSRDRLLVVVVAITSVLVAVDFRTNLIKVVTSFLILSTWYFRKVIPLFWLKILHFTLFFLPLVLLFLAISGQYNVFTAASKNEGFVVKANKGNIGDDESLTADTRTFLYIEVFKSLNARSGWFFGEGAVGKYKTESFDNLVTGNERFGSEVGFLNTLLYSGIFGVTLYALLLFIVSHNAIYYSNNWLSKMLGLIIISRWVLFFLEEFTQFDLNFYFLWIIIGLVSSKQFRAISDEHVGIYFSKFRNKYLKTVNTLRLNPR
jgi:hypothetical protein